VDFAIVSNPKSGICVKFWVKHWWTATETFETTKKPFEDDATSGGSTTIERYKLEDGDHRDSRSGRFLTSRNDEMALKLRDSFKTTDDDGGFVIEGNVRKSFTHEPGHCTATMHQLVSPYRFVSFTPINKSQQSKSPKLWFFCFCFFRKSKSISKANGFDGVKTIETNAANQLEWLKIEDYRHCLVGQ